MISEYRIVLDVHQTGQGVQLRMKRTDTARAIYVTLSDGGNDYIIPDSAYAVFAGLKADGKVLFNHCEIVDNTIVYNVTEQTTAAPGVVECEIRLFGGDGKLLTSPDFSIVVEEQTVADSSISSKDEVTALANLIDEAQRLINEMGTAMSRLDKALVLLTKLINWKTIVCTDPASQNNKHITIPDDQVFPTDGGFIYVSFTNGSTAVKPNLVVNQFGYAVTANDPDGNMTIPANYICQFRHEGNAMVLMNPLGSVSKAYVDTELTKKLDKAWVNDSLVSDKVGWTSARIVQEVNESKVVFTAVITNEVGRLVCDMTASEIINNARKGIVKATYTDDASGETRTYQYAKQTKNNRAVFEKTGYIEDGVTHQSLIYVDYAGNVTVETREPTATTVYATCTAEAAPSTSSPVTWYVPKTMPRPSRNTGMMVDVFWQNGRADGLGYDVTLVWGEEGGSDNETIIHTASVSSGLTGEYSIPAQGTVRYQLEETNGRERWKYVSGNLISRQFSTATAAATADKTVPGMAISYLPGMEIYVQMDEGNTAETMRLVPDEGATLPVYGNGVGAKTGTIPAGAILHLKNAGDHWQIINGGGSGGGPISLFPLTFTGAVEAEYDGTVPVTVPIPSGGGSTDISLGITGANMGMIPKVSSVDAAGKPTKYTAEYISVLPTSDGSDKGKFLRVYDFGQPIWSPAEPLTFTGAVSAEYDGTAPVSVDIPENYPVVEETASTLELTPNIYHKWGEMAALSITLGAETPGVVNEYCGEFVSGSAPTTFSVPSSVKWVQTLKVEASKKYQFSIINDVGVIGGA